MHGRVKPPNSHVIRVNSGNATDDVNFMRLSYTDELNVKGSNLEKEAHSHIDISVQYMAFPVNSVSIFFFFPCCLFTFNLLPPPFPFFPPFLISLVFSPSSIYFCLLFISCVSVNSPISPSYYGSIHLTDGVADKVAKWPKFRPCN